MFQVVTACDWPVARSFVSYRKDSRTLIGKVENKVVKIPHQHDFGSSLMRKPSIETERLTEKMGDGYV